jgi:hypothetical protein
MVLAFSNIAPNHPPNFSFCHSVLDTESSHFDMLWIPARVSFRVLGYLRGDGFGTFYETIKLKAFSLLLRATQS